MGNISDCKCKCNDKKNDDEVNFPEKNNLDKHENNEDDDNLIIVKNMEENHKNFKLKYNNNNNGNNDNNKNNNNNNNNDNYYYNNNNYNDNNNDNYNNNNNNNDNYNNNNNNDNYNNYFFEDIHKDDKEYNIFDKNNKIFNDDNFDNFKININGNDEIKIIENNEKIKKIPFSKSKKTLNKNIKNEDEDYNNLFDTTLKKKANKYKSNKNITFNNFSIQSDNSDNFSSIQNGVENKKKNQKILSNFYVNKNKFNNFSDDSDDNNNFNDNNLYNNKNKFLNEEKNNIFHDFLESHKMVKINNNEYNNITLLNKLKQLKYSYEFFSDLKKITFSGNKNNIKKYINRFCAIKNLEFQCYNSKDKFILNNPLSKISLKDIKKVNLCEFKIDMNNSKINNNKIVLYHFILYANEDTFEVYASEKEELINKWVYILKFFITNNI